MASRSDSSTPTIDVIIPARNEARFLGECLTALAAQDYPLDRVTVYVVDNGSTDNTAAIASGFANPKLRVSLIQHERRGAGAARNAAIRAGNGELLALLDAHCLIEPAWLRTLASRFSEPDVGGCQATIVSRATSPRVARYLERSGEQSNERILDDTVRGKRNLYPWMLSGNSMYRRHAVERAGGFDEQLRACEDVDLAWRVVLLGYRLAHESNAVAVHYDTNSWWRFIRKGLAYGAGAAELTRRYAAHGAKNKFAPSTLWSASIDRSLSAACYGVGYRATELRMTVGLHDAPSAVPRRPVAADFRLWFDWSANERARLSPNVVFWLRDDDKPESVVVHLPTRTRLVLDGVADRIWRALAAARPYDRTVADLSAYYGIAPVTAGADLNDFVEELVAGGFIERSRR